MGNVKWRGVYGANKKLRELIHFQGGKPVKPDFAPSENYPTYFFPNRLP